jgi:hypothetical protein
MPKLLFALLVAGAALAPQGAAAFWRRSQVSACSDATTEAERMRHRCWELDPYLDRGWPALGVGFDGAAGFHDGGLVPGRPALRSRPFRQGVTRRLG